MLVLFLQPPPLLGCEKTQEQELHPSSRFLCPLFHGPPLSLPDVSARIPWRLQQGHPATHSHTLGPCPVPGTHSPGFPAGSREGWRRQDLEMQLSWLTGQASPPVLQPTVIVPNGCSFLVSWDPLQPCMGWNSRRQRRGAWHGSD